MSRALRLRLPSPVHEAHGDERLRRRGVRLLLKRDDLIHPDFPGNKWRKLRHNLRTARAAGARTLLTFGGAYSNHLQATAAAGHHCGFATIGVVRGEPHLPLNPVLAAAVRHGMTLTYVDRTRYRAKTDPAFVAGLHEQFGDFFLIPEGGANADAVRGCAEIPPEITEPYDVVCCASGTGATLAGLAAGLPAGRRAIGFAVLRGDFLTAEVRRLQHAYGRSTANWTVEDGYHFGGFARRSPELEAFTADFAERHGVLLNPVYEAKMMYGLYDLVERGRFPAGTTVVAVLA